MTSTSAGVSDAVVRKKRRSWFEPGKSCHFEVVFERNDDNGSDSDIENVAELTLTSFAKPPIIEFGNVKVGQSKVCNLLVKNPEDAAQEVCAD